MAARRPGTDLGPDPVTERIFAAVVLAAGALATVAWAGAALAAAVGGTWPLPASLADAAGALARLPRHLGHPAAAWPPAPRAVLPGPFVYWAAQVVVLAAGVAATVAGVAVWRRHRAELDGLGVDRSAAFATQGELAPLRVEGPVPGRLVLGSVGRCLVATEPGTSVCLVGPSGSRKTTGLCVPMLLEHGPGAGAVLSTSVKGDVYAATQLRRASLGEVKVFDPTCSVVTRSATWSPLRAAGTVTGAQAAARALVDVASRAGMANGDFWMDSAADLLWGLLFVAAGTGGTMADVVRWVATHDRPIYSGDGQLVHQGEVAAALGELGHNANVAPGEVKIVSESLGGIWAEDERTRSSVYATARTTISAWSDPVVARSAEGSEITPEWLLSGDNTLYVVAPARAQARLRPVFAGLVSDMVDAAFEVATSCGGLLDTRLLVLLDEAANICPVKELPAWCSTCASHGITLVTVWQDRSQQRARYGDEGAETIWNNSGAKVVLSGLADKATAEVSGLLGEERYQRESSSLELAGGRRSVSTATAERRLVTADALRRQPPGQGLLVYKHLAPMRLALRPWYDDAGLRALKERGR